MENSTIPTSDEKLLEQCDVFTFRSGGKGGQHVNKTESGVRLVHRPSGIVVRCTAERSQHLNKSICIKRLRTKLNRLKQKKKKRIPTKTPFSAKKKRREEKRAQKEKKRLRSKPPLDT
ncbi:peptide chain release factor-like protein [Chitinispirillales bacterium ANBcel5]|uniref:peptide chain release factor-like protein n=1 Tax=Cellulosispirillum alkaliphilum TaxID=3039283 RepID=UPI002A5488BE|nr:peptide chain release factor-like protein [Chitinispirillales bacterium ANBcel5]